MIKFILANIPVQEKMLKNKKIAIFLFFSLFLFLHHFYAKVTKYHYPDRVTTLSISSNGQSVVSTHHGKLLVLWDIENKTSKLLSENANIYSASYIRGTNEFIWQEVSNNNVHISNNNNLNKTTFNPGFASYGQLETPNKETYIASDKEWNIFKIHKGKEVQLKSGFHDDYHGKLINLSIYDNLLLTSGVVGYRGDDNDVSEGLTGRDLNPKIPERVNYSLMRGVVLWDINTGKAIRKFNGNSVKTHATLSPDGNYVAAVDENSGGFVWETSTGKLISDLYSLVHGKYIPEKDGKPFSFDKTGLIPMPKDYCWTKSYYPYPCDYIYSSTAVKFINNSQFLRFTNHVPYAILYDVTSPRHKKYLKLEGHPMVAGFNAPSYISTAPKKNLLVMASARDEGIRVYQFNPKDETLKLIWAPTEINRTWQQKLQRLWQKLIA